MLISWVNWKGAHVNDMKKLIVYDNQGNIL